MINKTHNRQISLTLIMLCIFAVSMPAQSGGTFVIQKSVIAGGGGKSVGGAFEVNGTIGQSVAGLTSSEAAFQLTGGFWGGSSVPVSDATISGRVSTPTGLGLRNAVVSLISSSGVRRIATTSSFGIYSFEMVPTGQNYTITVGSKRYRFAPQFVTVQGTLVNVDFIGLE